MEFDDLKPQYTNILLSIDYFSSSIFLFDIINLSMLWKILTLLLS